MSTVILPIGGETLFGQKTGMLADVLARIQQCLETARVSESRAAKDAGLSSDAIRNMRRRLEKGETEAGASTKTIGKLATYFGVRAEWLLNGDGEAQSDQYGDAVFISGQIEKFAGPRDVEKVGVVAAGDDGDFAINGEVIDRVARPRGLMSRAGVWAMEIISDSMYPAYRKGDVVFCDRETPNVGDDVVIELFPEEENGPTPAFVKRLKRRTKGALIVEQFNPAKDLTFDPYSVRHIWRVVPNRELHGY